MNTQPTEGALKAYIALGNDPQVMEDRNAVAEIIDREAVLPAVRELVEALAAFVHPDGLSSLNLRNNLSTAKTLLAKYEGKL
jgi:hypothetical protein